MFGSPWDKLLIIAVLTSASASTQTTILPTARTTLSMARWGALPEVFGKVNPRYMTPSFSTIGMGVLSILWTMLLVGFNPAQDVLGDSITALGFSVCFYYGFTGLACAVYFRKQLFTSVEGVLPGRTVAARRLRDDVLRLRQGVPRLQPAGRRIREAAVRIQIPIVIGIGTLLLGVPLMLIAAVRFREFFRRRPEVAPEGIL